MTSGDFADLLDGKLALAIAFVALAGLVRGFSGFGSALVLTPSLSALYGPIAAVPVLILLEVSLSFQLLRPALRLVVRREVLILSLAAAAMTPLGAWILTAADPAVLRWSISIGILLFLLALLAGWRRRLPPTGVGLAVTGALSGLGNGASGIGGPPVVLYYLAGTGSAAQVRATVIVYFFAIDLLALAWMAAIGLVTLPLLILAAVMLPVAILGVWIGAKGFARSSERVFRLVAFGIIAAVALLSVTVG